MEGDEHQITRAPKKIKKHYRKRVKAECTIHSKKAMPGDKVYSKLPSARANEETLRWINHNINVLNRARCEWNINPKFMGWVLHIVGFFQKSSFLFRPAGVVH